MVFFIGVLLIAGFLALVVHFKAIVGAFLMFFVATVVWLFEDRKPKNYSRSDYHD